MKKGISLIVLVITIIVIIILSGSVILSLSNNNPITSATEAAFKQSAQEYNSALALYLASQYTNAIPAGSYNPATQANFNSLNIDTVIPNIKTEDKTKYEIQAGKLVYVGINTSEVTMLTAIGIAQATATPVGLAINVIATDNVTLNGAAASYNNPIIPKGFKAINTTDASWSNLATDWNNGLVIEDANANQFVWVPVDGTNVTFAKWTTTGIAYNDASISDDTTPSGFNATSITTTYKGFYIARYESMFDYNGGSLRVASKVSTNKTTLNWSTTRNNTYNGYLWNFVNYTDSKTYSENMDTAYSYDTAKVGTNLITGAQWDTVLKWVQNSGKSVTDTRTWGNHSDSTSPANVSGFGSLQISGYNNNWKAKNIYDLAGNTWEWTSEIYSSYRVHRGGGYADSGSTYPAAYRDYSNATHVNDSVGFRVALYVL